METNRACIMLLSFLAVVKTTVLLADINDFNNVNDVYKQCKYTTGSYRKFVWLSLRHTNAVWRCFTTVSLYHHFTYSRRFSY